MAHSKALKLSQRGADAVLSDLGTTLRDFLTDAQAKRLSYETTARDLYIKTNGAVDITGSTVRRWMDDLGIGSEPIDARMLGQ